MKKVTHLTSVHSRYDTRIFLKECISLAKINNFKVSLIVADGNGNEIKNNISIYDVGQLKGRINRIFKTTKKVFQKAIELDSDLYHFHDPELIPVGLKLKKLGYKVIFDIHENTDLQILEKDWIPYPIRSSLSFFYKNFENYACKKFDYLFVPQLAMFDKYSKLEKTEVIANFPTNISIDNYDKKLSKYKLLYSGSIGESRGLWNMLDLLEKLLRLESLYTLTIAGNMSSELLIEAKKHSAWSSVNYLGFISQEELKIVYQEHTIGLIMFNNVGQYYMAYALKLFEYMLNGLTVMMPNFGDWIVFNNDNNAGYNIDVRNSIESADILNNITDDTLKINEKRNKNLVLKKFTWKNEEDKLIYIYKELLDVK